MGETPTTIFISCIAIVLVVLGVFWVWSASSSYYGVEVDQTFANSMNKTGDLVSQYHSMDAKMSNTTGMYDTGTGSLLFDGLNTIVLGLRATKAVLVDFTGAIAYSVGIPPFIIQLLCAILVTVLIAAIISALWSRDV